MRVCGHCSIALLPPIIGKTSSAALRTPLEATAGGGSGEMRIHGPLISTQFLLPNPPFLSLFSVYAEVVLRTGPSIHAGLRGEGLP